MCVVMRARDLAPEIESQLSTIDEQLGTLRGSLEQLCGEQSASSSTLGSLYSWTSSPDDSEWEAKFIAVMTIQIHARGARAALFGPEQGEEDTYEEPVPTLEQGEELRAALDDIDAALTSARQTLRDEHH